MSPYVLGLSNDMLIMAFLAMAAYVLLLVGRVSFGLQAFFGLGAYASGLATAMAHWPLLPALGLAALLGALLSWLLAWPTMRLSGLRYAVATLAFAEMARIALSAWTWQVQTPDGWVGPQGVEGFRNIRWLLTHDVSDGAYWLLCALALALVLGVQHHLEQRQAGLHLRMVGQDDVLSAQCGVDVGRVRLLAAAWSGALAALGGALYAHRTTYIEPALFDPMLGVHAVGYALIGGLGTPVGPLLGVGFDLGLLNAVHGLESWRMVVFGGLVALFLRIKPRGLLDESWVHRLTQARPWRPARLIHPPLKETA